MLTYSDIAKIFGEIELRLISSLKRNLGRHKSEEQQYGFDWTAWQAEKIKNINKFRQENARIMNSYTGLIDSQTRQIMLDEFSQGVNGVFPESDREPHFFGVDETKVNKLIEDVTHLEKQAETSALRLTDDVYRQTVNRVQLAMSTGSMTLQQAIDMSVKDFLNQGINSIVYSNGRRVNIEDYVRMALRTTATRANLQGQSAKIKALGYDTVIVSHYSMCSPTCLPWQGQPYIEDVFSDWDGEKRYVGDVIYGKSNYCGKWFPLLSSAVQGGLFHPNCRHTISMWRDGDPIPRPQDNSDNNRRYKLEQQQRKLEREVRKAKRRVAGISDPNNINQAKRELREAQKNLRDFIEQTNQNEGEKVLSRDYGREKVYDSTYLSYYNKKSLDNSVESDIIEEKTRTSKFEDIKNTLINDVGFKRVDSSLNKIDEKLLSENVEQLKLLENRFGIIHKSDTSIISEPNENAFAIVESSRIYPTKQTLNLCTDSYDNRYKHLVLKRSDQRTKWNMPCLKENLPVYAVTHEYGHMLQHYLVQKKFEEYGWTSENPEKFIDDLAFTNKRKYEWYELKRQEVENQCLKEIFEIAEKKYTTVKPFNALSEYGQNSKSESFAEIFANSQLGEPNVLGKAMLIWLNKKELIINGT